MNLNTSSDIHQAKHQTCTCLLTLAFLVFIWSVKYISYEYTRIMTPIHSLTTSIRVNKQIFELNAMKRLMDWVLLTFISSNRNLSWMSGKSRKALNTIIWDGKSILRIIAISSRRFKLPKFVLLFYLMIKDKNMFRSC